MKRKEKKKKREGKSDSEGKFLELAKARSEVLTGQTEKLK